MPMPSQDGSEPIRRVAGSPDDPFDPDSAVPEPSEQGYARAVATSVERIRRGSMRKVVLARTMHVDAGRTLDPVRLAHRLRAVDPHAYTFISRLGHRCAGPDGRSSLLVGASPELLVARHGRTVRSTPLAGSAPRAGDPEEDRANAEALFASSKNRQEHAIVVDAIAETLGPRCDAPRLGPRAGALRDRERVASRDTVRGHAARPGTERRRAGGGAASRRRRCAALPDDVAAATIAELEPFDRGGYAGRWAGWTPRATVSGRSRLRCAELDGRPSHLVRGRRDRAAIPTRSARSTRPTGSSGPSWIPCAGADRRRGSFAGGLACAALARRGPGAGCRCARPRPQGGP